MKLKLSKLCKGFGHVVSQSIVSHDGDLKGSVFSWRARKDSYQHHIPTSLCIPFLSWEQAGLYVQRCYENHGFVQNCCLHEGYNPDIVIRPGTRTKGVCEVKILFPMLFNVKDAVRALEKFKLETFLPF